MPKFAATTSVSVDKSKSEIEAILRRYGASHFAYLIQPDKAVIAFRASGRNIRFDLPLGDKEKFVKTPKGRVRSKEHLVDGAYEQDCRSRWRALALCIKAKLEAVESSIETFDEAFMPHIVMPDGKTVKEHVLPKVILSYKEGKTLPLLLTDH